MALTDNLWGVWEYDGDWTDSAGSRDLTANGNASINTTNHKLGTGCSEYDGNADYAQNSGNLGSSVSTCSMASWIKHDTGAAGDGVMGWNASGNGFRMLSGGSTDSIRVEVNGTSQYGEVSQDITSDWVHVVTVFDGGGSTNSDRLKVYINGSLASLSFTGTIPSSFSTQFAAFRTGDAGVVGKWWDGLIDQSIVWTKTLSSDEITNLYNGGSGLVYPFIVTGEVGGIDNTKRSLLWRLP